jgi:hypothetical protein
MNLPQIDGTFFVPQLENSFWFRFVQPFFSPEKLAKGVF